MSNRTWGQWWCGLLMHSRAQRRIRTWTFAYWPYSGRPTSYLEDFCPRCYQVLARLELPRNPHAEAVRAYYGESEEELHD